MQNESISLEEISWLFIKLGLTAFGGPAAHIAMMQKEVVEKRKWMDHEHFMDLIGATNLIPGPNSTEMAIHIGHERGGWKGLILAGFCFIIPAILGSGYVLFAFLDSELVAKGLLTRTQLVDAIAVGQFTPGPVFSSVTFIGWQMNVAQGAVLATVAVLLPSFVFVALLNPLVPRMRKSRLFSAILDGVNIASLAIILTVCISFGRETISDWRTVVIAVLSLIVTFGFRKINTAFLIIRSAVLGYALQFL